MPADHAIVGPMLLPAGCHRRPCQGLLMLCSQGKESHGGAPGAAQGCLILPLSTLWDWHAADREGALQRAALLSCLQLAGLQTAHSTCVTHKLPFLLHRHLKAPGQHCKSLRRTTSCAAASGLAMSGTSGGLDIGSSAAAAAAAASAAAAACLVFLLGVLRGALRCTPERALCEGAAQAEDSQCEPGMRLRGVHLGNCTTAGRASDLQERPCKSRAPRG